MMKVTVLTTCALLLIGEGLGLLTTRPDRVVAQSVKIEPGNKPTPKPAAPTPTPRKPIVNRTPRRVAPEIEMVLVPGGSFLMGSPDNEPLRGSDEGPQHDVTMPSFYIGKYEVTQAQWRAVMLGNPSNFKGDNLPVETVSWDDAKEFCRRLSQMTGKEYRLPTEAEWEYAARARTTSPFAFGYTLSSEQANFDGNYPYGNFPAGINRNKTTPVGSFEPNAFNLHDMHGNVWEWCEDVYHDNYNGAPTDGSAWLSGGDSSVRVLRGGSWRLAGESCRSAVRVRFPPGVRSLIIGFRVVVSERTL
jgi:eukaryotic-like serine/threonine-protein kinase